VNEYGDLSQNFECLEERHLAFAKHILGVIKSNSLLHKFFPILCKLKYSFVHLSIQV